MRLNGKTNVAALFVVRILVMWKISYIAGNYGSTSYSTSVYNGLHQSDTGHPYLGQPYKSQEYAWYPKQQTIANFQILKDQKSEAQKRSEKVFEKLQDPVTWGTFLLLGVPYLMGQARINYFNSEILGAVFKLVGWTSEQSVVGRLLLFLPLLASTADTEEEFRQNYAKFLQTLFLTYGFGKFGVNHIDGLIMDAIITGAVAGQPPVS